MKEFLTKTFSSKPITVCGVLFILVAPTRLANADPLQEARVSQIIQDVRLLEAHAAPHPAAVNDKITVGSAVRTGVESRAELTFKDLTITRLGANTIFSFTAGARQAELTKGTILLQVPPNAPAVRANTTAVTVAVMGGTALLSTGPPTKFMVLEGTGTIYPLGHPEKAVTVRGGEMVTAEGGHVSKPEKFDVKLVLATSALIADFAPLTNLPLILAVVDQQLAEQLILTTNQLPSKSMIETIDVTDQNANANPVVVANTFATPTPPITPTPSITPPPTPTPSITPPPTPTPSKFGTPSTITSPNPYVITSGTVITTDPSITTNGVTDFGKIYRGSADDGPFTLWAFGSTSAFDNAINLDTDFFADPNHLPIAAFKFQNLSLNGNPTIDLSNGGVTKLALIGVNGITSGPPGGVLTFTGLDLLVLATVNGSINLTSDVSFQNLNELAMYARGAGSNLILNSPISNIGALYLAAEGSIQLTNPGTMSVGEFEATAGNNLTLQIGGSLLLNGKVRLNTLVLPGTTVANGANVTLNITGDYTNSSATEFSLLHVRNDGAHIGTGGNIGVNIGGNLTAMSDFSLLVENTNGQIDNGGNLTLRVGNNLNVNGLDVELQNNAGTIGGDAAINVSAANITANSLVAQIDNTGGSVGASTAGGATINMNVSSSATVTNDATVAIYGSDGAVGGAAININGGSYNVGGTFLSYIDGNGTITFNNAFAHADVLKAGVFGANGALNIGGGILSADSELKLYAPGSNGTLNFLSNVTLGGSAVKILAANTINILDGVVVTIGGATPAEVYTTNANYTGFGGNGTTTGTFAGAGANNPLPLNQAPPFGAPPPGHSHRGTRTDGVINVGNTAELLALLDGATVGPDGTVMIHGSKTIFRDLNRMNPNALLRAERRMMMQQTRDNTRESMRARGQRIL